MLPSFVIGLREGLEAALIVGIIAAFLRKQGRADLLRWLFAGVAAAVLLCVGVGVALDVVSRDLPQRQQEGLETVVGVLAVGMVTYMVIWMRRHARELKGQLEGLAADAIATSGGNAARAMVVMAFLAVLREGFETVVFLLAAFNEADSRATAGTGALLGVVIAVGLGYGIYRGGVRIDLARFFRATGLVLVLVAAGLVLSALHTAHEAGWLSFGQARTVDLTGLPIAGWLLRAGSVQASLLTGMLGIQPRPVLIEVVGWLVYLIPVGCYVAWPAGRRVPHQQLARALCFVGVSAGVVALTLALVAPAIPTRGPVTRSSAVSAQLLSSSGNRALFRTVLQSPANASTPVSREASDLRLRNEGLHSHRGLVTELFTGTFAGSAAGALPRAMSMQRLSDLGGGRLPLGARARGSGDLAVRYQDVTAFSVWDMPGTGRIVDWRWTETVSVLIVAGNGSAIPVDEPLRVATSALPPAIRSAAEAGARADRAALDARSTRDSQVWLLVTVAALALAGAAGLAVTRRSAARNATAVEPETRILAPV